MRTSSDSRAALRLVRASFTNRPTLEIAVSHALLLRVARGEIEPTLRVYRPGPTVAFGRLDALAPGYAAAVAAARAVGFEAILRPPGGHAAAYDEQSLGLDEVTAEPEAIAGIYDRFRRTGALLAGALEELGVDARVGAVPGEYCRGEYSVNARDRVKLAGTAQRVVRGGALLGATIVVGNGARIRTVLEAVYARLGLDWEPATAGAVADEVPGATFEAVRDAVLAAYAARVELVEAELDPVTLALAAELERRHAVA
jgi:octanoyl-[GcvH]:protein N-octanoyltransferase